MNTASFFLPVAVERVRGKEREMGSFPSRCKHFSVGGAFSTGVGPQRRQTLAAGEFTIRFGPPRARLSLSPCNRPSPVATAHFFSLNSASHPPHFFFFHRNSPTMQASRPKLLKIVILGESGYVCRHS